MSPFSYNGIAYLEPLCTIPEYRGRGLAAAALSEIYRRTKKLGGWGRKDTPSAGVNPLQEGE